MVADNQQRVLVVGEIRNDSYFSDVRGLTTIREADDRVFSQLEVSKSAAAKGFHSSIGGRGANLAINLSRMGFSVDLWSLLGQEALGSLLLGQLDTENINTDKVVRLNSFTTAAAVHILDRSLGRQSTIAYNTNWQAVSSGLINLSANHYDWAFVASTGGNFSVLNEIFLQLKQHNVKLAFNPGEGELADRNKLLGLLEDVDVLILNRSEAEQIVKGNNLDELATKLSKYVKMVVITSSEDGSIACDGKTVWRSGIYPPERVADQTGAGDAFGSAFLASMIRERTTSESLIFASANASRVVACVGATCSTLTSASGLKQLPIRERSL